MSKPQKIVIKLGMPSPKNRTKAMVLAAKVYGVSSVAITGDDKDQLEVVGVDVDTACLVSCLRKKVLRRADIMVVEEAKDKKKEEEKKKLEELLQRGWPGYYHPQHHYPPLMVACEEPVTGCSIM
ncbi:hypothetical protein SEVIR_7G140100v4 [Setaria viridis]|uniref:HMA domain-containing protein n=2 Tax=Setaria TaxID=4554 RepID=K3YDQ6_SETIT|nr:uncharacterized protein LOC111257818 [Setaria italica]XP_034604738.1 uncharacterized protein LOC117864746 [Setaria viridis]RCV34048.1 hypothetical protein SETIT_7G131600v2 [Setaria italica]TKW04890.1 hypothetical protein SEVIR_7G140100v2 [Setaria viridis]